jgi:hypothetical protein
MRFRIKSAPPEEIKVPLEVNYYDEISKQVTQVSVSHLFSYPTTEQREQYQQKLVVVKGKKVKPASAPDAAWWLWCQCVKSVEGYDDERGVPIVCDKPGEWKRSFNNDVLRPHVEGAIQGLLDHIGANEGEIEKN